MDFIEKTIQLVASFALPITIVIIVLFFLFFIVRPFFAFLFDPDRVKNVKTLKDFEEKNKQKLKAAENEGDGVDTNPEDVLEFDEKKFSGFNNDQQTISKLAESDPNKAGHLIKEWLKEES